MVKTYPVPCTKKEIEDLISASAENDYYYTLFIVAKDTGRRLGEYIGINKNGVYIPGMQVKDIDFETKIFKTTILKRGNYAKKEGVLNEESARVLKQYIIRNNLKLDDYVFALKKRSSIQSAVKRYAKKARIQHNVMFHNFRHYFVTYLTRQGKSYDWIAKLTGHTTPQTLVHYDHTIASDIKKDALIALEGI
jgi:integrase